MEFLVEYLSEGHSFTEILVALIVIAGILVCIEKGLKWIYNIFIAFYKRKKGEEDEMFTLDKNTNEIKKLSEKIENLTSSLDEQYGNLDKKIEEQRERLDIINEEGKVRDCAILRDRIFGGMRYFCQNRDNNGIVHINITDHENMEHLFEAYFNCHGNGTVKTMYENEFKNWIIDK